MLSINGTFLLKLYPPEPTQSEKPSVLRVTTVILLKHVRSGHRKQELAVFLPVIKRRKPIMNESTQNYTCHLHSFQTSCILQQQPAKTPAIQTQNKNPNLKERIWHIIKSSRQQRNKIAENQTKITKLSNNVERARKCLQKRIWGKAED